MGPLRQSENIDVLLECDFGTSWIQATSQRSWHPVRVRGRWIGYPGCAAARRPWAVEYNAFSVETLRRHGSGFHSRITTPRKTRTNIAPAA